MDLGSALGGLAGGVGGFFLGGPVGAVAGAGIGAGLGSALGGLGSGGDSAPTLQADPYLAQWLAANPGKTAEDYYAQTAPGMMVGSQNAQDTATGLTGTANYALGRDAPTIGPVAVDNSRANQAYINAQGTDRTNQQALGAQATQNPFATQQQGYAGQVMGGPAAGAQRGLASYLQGQAMGTNGPSAAESVLRAGNDAASRNAMSIAASADPRDAASARKAAIMAAAQGGQQTANQAEMLRAQEMQSAQGQLGSVLGQERGQTQAGAQLGAGIYAGLEGQRQQGLGAAMGNASNVRGADLSAYGTAGGLALQNSGQQLQQEQAQAGVQQQQTALNQGLYLGGIGQATALSQSEAQRQQQYQLEQQALSNQRMSTANGQAVNAAQIGLQGQAQDWSQGMQLASMGFAGAGMLAAGAGGSQVAGQGAAAGLGAYQASTMASDVRLKKDVRRANEGEIREAVLKLRPVEYEYRDPAHGTGKVTGILAQDLERTEAGRRVVVETPIGKAIDLRKAVGLVLASEASLAKRVAKLELRKAAR